MRPTGTAAVSRTSSTAQRRGGATPGGRFARHFFLHTDQHKKAPPAESLVKLYQKRGKAEKHQRARKAACTLALSSSPRPNTHYHNRRVLRRHAAKLQEGKARAPGPYCSYISCCMWGAAHAAAGGSPHAPVELPAAYPESRSTHRAASTQHCYPGSCPCPCELGVFLEALSPASVEDNSLPLWKESDLRCSRKGAGATPGRRTQDMRDTHAHTRCLALKIRPPCCNCTPIGTQVKPP